MHEAYNKELIKIAEDVAKEKGIRLVHGVYFGTQGPAYETPAEYKAYHTMGADAVGMSTVPEVIVARHCGIRVFGISIITNMGISDNPETATHEEVQEAANQAQPRMAEIFRGIIQNADI
jgi:purine-nucleoside phosphorylase